MVDGAVMMADDARQGKTYQPPPTP